jgi:hypothetical protein
VVAKAPTQKLTADTMFTRVGALVGTPVSPEQALSSGEDIDTRTDVYSLGIIFYELLAGAPPIELRKIAFEEFLRRLREGSMNEYGSSIVTITGVRSEDSAAACSSRSRFRAGPGRRSLRSVRGVVAAFKISGWNGKYSKGVTLAQLHNDSCCTVLHYLRLRL